MIVIYLDKILVLCILAHFSNLLLFNACIIQVHCYQYLGLHIDSNLSWDVHVNSVCSNFL